MDTAYYLDTFKKIVDQIDKRLLREHEIEVKAVVWVDSVVLKMQKKSWVNKSPAARPFQESIFFSVWISDASINEGKLFYNIHALKLRQLTGYSIKSREFAEAFRLKFNAFKNKWPNVSVLFGPLTLMEGWVSIDTGDFKNEIVKLAHQFLEIDFIIDNLLEQRKKILKELKMKNSK